MKERDVYAEAFTLAWEHIEEMGGFSETEKSAGYEPLKSKVYELMEGGEMDPLYLATKALSWFRDQTQVAHSAERVLGRIPNEQT